VGRATSPRASRWGAGSSTTIAPGTLSGDDTARSHARAATERAEHGAIRRTRSAARVTKMPMPGRRRSRGLPRIARRATKSPGSGRRRSRCPITTAPSIRSTGDTETSAATCVTPVPAQAGNRPSSGGPGSCCGPRTGPVATVTQRRTATNSPHGATAERATRATRFPAGSRARSRSSTTRPPISRSAAGTRPRTAVRVMNRCGRSCRR
jgi:hypothetical protein